MAVHGDDDLVFLGEGRDPLHRTQSRGRGDEFDSERPGHLEAAINLIVSEVVIEAEVIGLQFDPRVVEFFADVFEMVERDRQAPLARLFLPLAHRFAHLRRHLSAASARLARRRALRWGPACGLFPPACRAALLSPPPPPPTPPPP